MHLFASQDVNWWTGVVWIIMFFISCLNSYSDGTHSLQGIHWWASDTFLTICSDEEQLGWPEREYIFSQFSFWRMQQQIKNRTLPGSRLFHLNGNEFNSGAISVLMCCYRCVKEAYSDWMRALWFKSPRQMEQCLISILSLTITYWHHFVGLRYYDGNRLNGTTLCKCL